MMRFVLTLCALVTALAGTEAWAKDVKGSADHPLIKRYAGSNIVGFTQKEFDEFEARIGPAKRGPQGLTWDDVIDLEGRVTRRLYRAPKDRSSLEVYKNYETALTEAGFETLYTCKKNDCGPQFWRFAQNLWPTGWIRDVFATDVKDPRYIAAKLSRPEGDVYAFAFVFQHTFLNTLAGPYVQLDTVDLKPIEHNMVVAKASELDAGLTKEGRVPVYGIFFDTDKDTIKAESKSALDEVGKLLKDKPALKVHIVGHTDGIGAIGYNMDLSQRRARAVASALVNTYGIAEDRLTAAGVGPLAPAASNASEKGRALNRRVELVEQYQGQ